MSKTLRLPAIAHLALCLPLVLGAGLLPVAALAAGPVSITDTSAVYSQNFDSLSGDYSALRPYTNGTTLEGWYLFNAAGTALNALRANNGSTTGGGLYHYGNSTDRALGGKAVSSTSGSFQGYVVLALTNNTGADISSFDLSYDGEQWYSGETRAAVPVSYRTGASYVNTGWTSTDSSFTFTPPSVGANAALDGNGAANRSAGLGGTVNTTWAAGETMWLRFSILSGGASSVSGVAIDNLSLSFTPAVTSPVPEPGTWALLAAGLALVWQKRRRA